MSYEFKLTGRDEANSADYLSRHPFTQPTKDNGGENYTRYVTNTAVPNALTLEETPWDELSVDFAGPFPTTEHLLIVFDDYSRFPEEETVNSTSARSVTPKLNQIFASFGTPSILKSDNGSPLKEKSLHPSLRNWGFTIVR
ncbi:transposon ty3-g Gag-Pol polyprotein [Plakobranchus ocellatus]|uniref:Transposon ty3-g Gag-Pol polyprotein n=1 Tax=Plakobranchus ocellatus TaxID=259542 RepID=A0AAV4C5Q6_9GAST|nr:transposon ty3-g Gag-Pol polyprotein [Plakobranchus ocellatus]